jgi:hypothetical protein
MRSREAPDLAENRKTGLDESNEQLRRKQWLLPRKIKE